MMSESDQSGNAVRENGPESSPAARKKRVLLVEDDARSRFILLNHLNKAGVEVELAANSALASGCPRRHSTAPTPAMASRAGA